jgi:hypothetical protein
MGYINLDTKKMEIDKDYLYTLNKKYVSCIQKIKTIISNNEYWEGNSADSFRNELKETCLVYDEVGTILKDYANFLNRTIQVVEKQAEVDLIK